ncbi:hypothetical protein SAMN05421858_3468 [Haladaptatus litoreus]|uniref:Uncharacterized protein n=1 Tax=Haladaptatus litoreus TaxID=553468 RepID=A0A1N7DAJ6_9EURY|nr:hypothetical protein SAMN05421858_3468 [Haladaptatus litoreus]
MPSTEQACARCGNQITDDDPHAWLTIQGVNLGYEIIDDDHVVCENCYNDYRDFINQSP